MYNEVKTSFRKHIDFILLDIVIMQVSFFIAYFLRHDNFYLYNNYEYRTIIFLLVFLNIISVNVFNSMHDVLKRPFQLEIYSTFKQVFLVETLILFFVFVTKTSEEFSRNVFLSFPIIYFLLSIFTRQIYKKIVKKFYKNQKNREFLVITTKDRMAEIVNRYYHISNDINLNKFVITDDDLLGKKYSKKDLLLTYDNNSNLYDDIKDEYIEVVSDSENLLSYLLNNHIDEVFICINGMNNYKKELIEKINLMGIIIHIEIDYVDSVIGANNKEFIEHILDYTVLTCTVSTISAVQSIVKKMIDIISGLIGTIITIVIAIILAPIIKLKSPGPVFFKQKRVGKNGKIFYMYKFRSMVVDAEKIKKELLDKNEQKDDLMFKMTDDPRVIKGIGNFIRDTSIDEFPQFINVLKGDMSLVGTRPPTIDEWEKYKMHHRARLSIKPGITGLWQVSGRSNIKDFEDVVKLDIEYIKNFSIWLDIKIILKTFLVVIRKVGAR